MKTQTALLAKYLALYQKKPHSKAFAPLAESYRKLGMLDSAYEVLRKGLKRHGDYVLGYIVLANCYLDENKDQLAYSTLRPLVGMNKDNIKLLSLFARACYEMSYFDEALEAYKYILLLNPQDELALKRVEELEDRSEIHQNYALVTDSVGEEDEEFDDWSTVELASLHARQGSEKQEKISEEKEIDEQQWQITDRVVEAETEEVNFDQQDDEQQEPLVTQTLVDIYCAQKHYQKAIDLLHQILKKNPEDQKAKDKLTALMNRESGEAVTQDDSVEKIARKYQDFLSLILKRSQLA